VQVALELVEGEIAPGNVVRYAATVTNQGELSLMSAQVEVRRTIPGQYEPFDLTSGNGPGESEAGVGLVARQYSWSLVGDTADRNGLVQIQGGIPVGAAVRIEFNLRLSMSYDGLEPAALAVLSEASCAPTATPTPEPTATAIPTVEPTASPTPAPGTPTATPTVDARPLCGVDVSLDSIDCDVGPGNPLQYAVTILSTGRFPLTSVEVTTVRPFANQFQPFDLSFDNGPGTTEAGGNLLARPYSWSLVGDVADRDGLLAIDGDIPSGNAVTVVFNMRISEDYDGSAPVQLQVRGAAACGG